MTSSDTLTKKTISRRKLLGAAGIGLSALPLMSTQVFAAANDATRPPTPYLASTAEKKINIISLERLEVEARGAIPKAGYEFVSGGAGDEWTLRENRRAFNDYRIAAKRLVGLSNDDIDIKTRLLGLDMPEDFKAMGSPFRPDANFANHDPKKGGFGNFFDQKTSLTPENIQFIKRFTGLPVIVKGILRPDDADRFIRAGADAIQVSNHGGRQIDGVPASITALPPIVKVVNNRVPIILDGGIRRGIDIVRAIAMGADAVAVGRPMMYGLGLGGAQGVQSVIEHLSNDLKSTMLLAGAAKLSDLNSSYIDIVGENEKFDTYNG